MAPDRSIATRYMSGASGRFTIDTNLLVYSVENQAGARHQTALEIVDRATECDCCITLQALSEFYVVVTRKVMVSPAEAAAQAEDWLTAFQCIAASPAAVRSALAVILTEDLAHDADFTGVRIHNPFSSLGALDPLTRQLLGLE